MNILFIGSSSDWHVDLWVKYFTKTNNVFLFSDCEDYLKTQKFENVTIIEKSGYISRFLKVLNSNSKSLHSLNKLISAKYYANEVDKIIRNNNIEIIHAHSLYYGFIASLSKSKVPIVFTPMGSDVIIHSQNSFIHRFMAKRAFKSAYITTGDSFLLQKRGFNVGAKKERNYIIQNGVDSHVFFPKKNKLKVKYEIKEKETLIFSPRAITPLYNIDIILDSIYYLKSTGYQIKCMFSFAFGNEYLKKLKLQASKLGINNNIIWLGYLSYEEMADHYCAADIVISIPSSDSSPKSVYEAMFCEKPVIVSDLEWSYEILANEDCLYRVKVRNRRELSAAIMRLINDTVYSNMLSRNSLISAKKYFDYTSNMQKIEEILAQGILEFNKEKSHV